MAKVKQGKIIAVDNKDRKFGANEKYYAIWIEDRKKQDMLQNYIGAELWLLEIKISRYTEINSRLN